jgi:hypothetical protein
MLYDFVHAVRVLQGIQDDREMVRTYDASDELAMLLRASAESGEPIRVRANDATYVVRIAEESREMWAGYDPGRVRDALRKYGGSWSDLDADELKAKMYRARDEGSRPTNAQ